jgi:hypothetical protein
MAVTAKLNVKLFADTVIVAESDDAELWRRVFAAIQKGNPAFGGNGGAGKQDDELEERDEETSVKKGRRSGDGPLNAFAEELGVDVNEVVGACAPETTEPYVRLDQRYWEALRVKTGSRGRTAIAPVALAGTLLCLWFKHAGLDGNPTIQQCQAVLLTINLRDQNAARSLHNADWLQTRGGTVVINPAQWSQAVKVAKAYCLKKAPKEVE